MECYLEHLHEKHDCKINSFSVGRSRYLIVVICRCFAHYLEHLIVILNNLPSLSRRGILIDTTVFYL